MILSATFSRPAKDVAERLGREYVRVKVRPLASAGEGGYFAEFFTERQAFHRRLSEAELVGFVESHAGTTFRSCVVRTESTETQIMASRKGKITRIERSVRGESGVRSDCSVRGGSGPAFRNIASTQDREKRRVLSEGVPVPFLVRLGVMTAEGRVVQSRRDKFRQINRFLEIVDDVLPEVMRLRGETGGARPLRVVDFGSGKSYLTFALHHFLREVRKIDCEVLGLDLKADVIEFCSKVAGELNLGGLSFSVGDIASFRGGAPDVVVTLHACDTATDHALDYAVRRGVAAILSVPCCQHELNAQVSRSSVPCDSPFEPLLRFGLIKERFAALATDAVRAETLERLGYRVQVLEFIDDANTPKNLLIRAVRNPAAAPGPDGSRSLLGALGARQSLVELSARGE